MTAQTSGSSVWRFTISPSTAYQLLDRYEREGKAGLAEALASYSHHSPNRTTAELEQAVLRWSATGTLPGEASTMATGLARPRLSPRCPAPALSRRSCVGTTGLPPTSQPRATGGGSSTLQPNDLWQDGLQGPLRHRSRPNCHPLTVLDDHSRFAIEVQRHASTSAPRRCRNASPPPSAPTACPPHAHGQRLPLGQRRTPPAHPA